MKNSRLVIAAVLFLVLCLTICWSAEYGGLGNPIGPSTVPPSSYSSGLSNSPNPIDTSGNLLITGNVRRGTHFRGPVPYGSTTSFRSSLGSSALSSFLRDSASSDDFGGYQNMYMTQPYYSPTETVPTMVPGRAGVFKPTDTRIRNRVRDVFGLEPLEQEQTPGRGDATSGLELTGPLTQYSTQADLTGVSEAQLRSMSLAPRSGEIDARLKSGKSVVEQFREQTEEAGVIPGLELDQGQSELTQSSGIEEDGSYKSFGQDRVSWDTQDVDFDRLSPSERGSNIQRPAESATGNGQTDAARYRLATLEEYTPSTYAGLQGNVVPQGRPGLSDMSGQPQADQQRPARGTLEALGRSTSDSPYDLTAGSGLAGVGQGQAQSDVLEQVRQQLDELAASIETRMQTTPEDVFEGPGTELLTKPERTPSGSLRYAPGSEDLASLRALQGSDSGIRAEALAPDATADEPGTANYGREQTSSAPVEGELVPEWYRMADYETRQKRSSPLDELKQLSRAELSAKAKRIMGPHGSLESLSEAKFHQHLLAAEGHLKAGRYYRAADSFALASIYKPDEPRVLVGRSHALFAAGEYISSALFLSRALAIAPEYARTKIDLATAVGGEKKLAGRIADVEQWLARSGSNELQFLVGYVYYQTGKLNQAKQAIDAAYQKVPQSPAVQALRTAIDARLKTQK